MPAPTLPDGSPLVPSSTAPPLREFSCGELREIFSRRTDATARRKLDEIAPFADHQRVALLVRDVYPDGAPPAPPTSSPPPAAVEDPAEDAAPPSPPPPEAASAEPAPKRTRKA